MKTILSTLYFFLSVLALAQPITNAPDGNGFIFNFHIKNNQLVGEGADILLNEISKCQFFLLGEQHHIAEISQFTNCLLPRMEAMKFGYFAVEIGPNSANRLVEEIRQNKGLYNFNTTYHQLCGEIPIPFFDGKDDEVFLITALENDFQIWGIDQEYLSAQFFLFKEIYDRSKNKKEIGSAYNIACAYMLEEFKKFMPSDDYPMFTNYLKSREINDFFSMVDNDNERIQSVIKNLKESWVIYKQIEDKAYRKNWQMRIEHLRSNFGTKFKEALEKDDCPKVFIKMGGVHLSKGLNSFGYFDLGNFVFELANYYNTKMTSVLCSPRFYFDDGKVIDDLQEEDPLVFVQKKAKLDQWTLFDNAAFLDYCSRGKIRIDPKLKIILKKYGYILIPPLTHEMKKNYQ